MSELAKAAGEVPLGGVLTGVILFTVTGGETGLLMLGAKRLSMVKTDDLRLIELAGWSPILWTPELVGIFFDNNLLLPLDGLVALFCTCSRGLLAWLARVKCIDKSIVKGNFKKDRWCCPWRL